MGDAAYWGCLCASRLVPGLEAPILIPALPHRQSISATISILHPLDHMSSPSSVWVDLSTLAPNTLLYTNRLSYSRMTSALSNILSLTS